MEGSYEGLDDSRTHQHVGTSAHAGAAEGAVEMDPNRRYIRYPILLGRGACKRVYKGDCSCFQQSVTVGTAGA